MRQQILFDGHLSDVIAFSYNAKAVDGQLCLEASPNENQTFFAHSPHATLLEVLSERLKSFIDMLDFLIITVNVGGLPSRDDIIP